MDNLPNPSYRPYTHFVTQNEPKVFKTDYASANQYIGASVGCNCVQTYTGQVGYRRPPPAGTSVRNTQFYEKNGTRSYRTEQGFKDIMGVPTYTEKHPRIDRLVAPSARTPKLFSPAGTPQPDCSLHPFTQPDLNDPRFSTPGMYKTSYKRDYLDPGSNIARPAGKSYFRIG
mmetsp:Transcript_3130/g.7291  ORF Transcript_3130/g.7291 Transcript_3130/m.7291 type:complete len:172 (+) Transcript_3130:116-631(+)